MGQYGNQPDFGTRAKVVVPTGDPVTPIPGEKLNSAALYIGTGGDLVVTVVGGNSGVNQNGGATIFRNIPNGTFFPVIVNNIWEDDNDGVSTSCSDIIALY
jgi:hypothetical protein